MFLWLVGMGLFYYISTLKLLWHSQDTTSFKWNRHLKFFFPRWCQSSPSYFKVTQNLGGSSCFGLLLLLFVCCVCVERVLVSVLFLFSYFFVGGRHQNLLLTHIRTFNHSYFVFVFKLLYIIFVWITISLYVHKSYASLRLCHILLCSSCLYLFLLRENYKWSVTHVNICLVSVESKIHCEINFDFAQIKPSADDTLTTLDMIKEEVKMWSLVSW